MSTDQIIKCQVVDLFPNMLQIAALNRDTQCTNFVLLYNPIKISLLLHRWNKKN
jgi:hypothetical protein